MKQIFFNYLSKLFIFSLFIFISLFIIGCTTQSLVYSPSINLPPEPLKKNQIQLLGGIGLLPEARPHEVGESTAIGGEATFRFAFSNHFVLQAKGWKDFSNNVDANRGGFSISSIITLNSHKSSYRIGIIPTLAYLHGGGGLGSPSGMGAMLPVCLWFPKSKYASFYISLGPGFGAKYGFPIERNEWGWGILLNMGTSLIASKNISFNFEVSGIKQINKYDEMTDFIIAPSFNLSLIF